MFLKVGMGRLALLHDLWEIAQAVSVLVSDFPEVIPDAENVFADLLALAATRSGLALVKLVADVNELYKNAMSNYSRHADAIEAFLDAVRQLIADARG